MFTLRETPGQEVEVCLGGVMFCVLSPVRLYGGVANCAMRCENTVLQIVGMGNSKFVFQGGNEIVVGTLHLDCGAIGVHSGSLWLDPKQSGNYWPSHLTIGVQRTARVGWGENLANQYPWSANEGTLKDPMHASMATELVQRLRGREIVVLENYDPPDDDDFMRSIAQEYGGHWRRFLMSLVECFDGVSRNPIDSSGSKQKFRIVGVQWKELEDACKSPSEAWGEYEQFVSQVRDLL